MTLKIIITYPTFFPGELKQIIQVLENEDCRLHLRKPDYFKEEYEDLLQTIPVKYHGQIVLHDYYSLHEKYAVGGLHLSTKMRNELIKEDVFKISTLAHWHIGTFTLSTSCHSIEELRATDGQFEYAFLSPIFPSISKQGYEGNLDMLEVEAYLQTSRKTKVVALGGIGASKIKMIETYGFDGYAQLGSIWKL